MNLRLLFISFSLGCFYLVGLPDGIAAGKFYAYCVSGVVRDSGHSGAISSVEVRAFFKGGDPAYPVGITSTDSNGHFSLCFTSEIRTLVFIHPSYHSNTIREIVFNDSLALLGNVMLGPSAVVMQGAGAKAKKQGDKIEVDKKSYVVGNSVLTTGGTAVDALRQVPAVSVDPDGNITLRGSDNVTIYINGKQSSLSGADRLTMLQQIPAANIESIEVNTNPGAKQDAEGVSGIINITLKKNTNKGRSGYVTIGAGDRNKYNGSANLNYNKGKWGFSNTLSFRQNDIWGKWYNERDNFIGDTSFFIDQYSRSQNLFVSMALSGSVDYNVNKNLVISANYLLSRTKDTEEETNRIFLGDDNDSLNRLIRRMTYQSGGSKNMDMGLTLRKSFDKPAHNLVAMINYSGTARNNSIEYMQRELSTITESEKNGNPFLLYNNNANYFSTTLVQMDYTRPIQKDKKFEAGLKFTGRNIDNDFMVDSFDHALGINIVDKGQSNHFFYSENVSAVYGMLSHTLSELVKYNFGLRLENTSVYIQQLVLKEVSVMNYANLFPSGNVNFTLQKKYGLPDIQLSYSRRITRPNQWQLNPFVSYSDPYNLTRGNPKLRAELTDALELSAYYNTKPVVLTASVYYRQTNMPVSRYRTVDSTGVSTTSFYNLDFNRSTGAELVARFTLMKNIKLTLNGNLYKYVLSGNLQGNNFISQRLMYSGKANLNYTFWKKTEFQSSFSYMGPFLTAQGWSKSSYGLDAGVKKDLVKDKLSLSVNVSDIFNNRRFYTTMSDVNFAGNSYRKRESRIITVNLLWKFGQDNQADKKPKLPELMTPEF